MRKNLLLLATVFSFIYSSTVAKEKPIIDIDPTQSMCVSPVSTVANPTLGLYFSNLFDSSNWPARWTCGSWSNLEGWIYISSDISIFIAYLSIPIMLFWFIRKRDIGKARRLVFLFAAFILLCGFTHLIDAILFWEPVYRFSGFLKALTGIVSLGTATVLGFVIPKALDYKRPEDFQKAVRERKKIENQFELFVKFSPGAIAMFDNDMRYIIANDGWYSDYKLTEKEIIGKSHYEVFPEIKEMPEWLDHHQKALQGEKLSSDFDSFDHNGSTTYLRWKLMPWFKADNEIGGIIMFTEIITDEVIMQDKLKESELRFTNIFNKAQFAVALVKDDGVPFLVNSRFCKLLNYTEDELTSMSFVEFTHPDDVDKDVKLYKKLLNDEIDSYTIEKRYLTKDGGIKYVKLNVTMVDEGTEIKYALALVEDVTDRVLALQMEKKSMIKIKEMNRVFSEISSIAKIGTWEVDLESGFCDWSDTVYEIHELDNSLEIDLENAINYYHPDDRSVIQKAVDKSIKDGNSWDLELRILTSSGNEKWVRAIGRSIGFDNGKTKLQGLFQDIDIKKRYELEISDSHEQLERIVNERTADLKEAIDELESFSYSVSHDLRAPLRAINGYSEALIEDYGKTLSAEANQFLKRIGTNSQKMGQLIDDLLEFSRMNRKQTKYEEVDSEKLIDQIVNDLYAQSKSTIVCEKLPSIIGDKKMLSQVFSNLIGNAVKYSSKEKNPQIVISSHSEEIGHTISIADNGVGFNMEYYDKLFQVFQRLHSESDFEGTGIGLSLCAKIMKAHNGDIWAESEEGKGATFYLKFKKNINES